MSAARKAKGSKQFLIFDFLSRQSAKLKGLKSFSANFRLWISSMTTEKSCLILIMIPLLHYSRVF